MLDNITMEKSITNFAILKWYNQRTQESLNVGVIVESDKGLVAKINSHTDRLQILFRDFDNDDYDIATNRVSDFIKAHPELRLYNLIGLWATITGHFHRELHLTKPEQTDNNILDIYYKYVLDIDGVVNERIKRLHQIGKGQSSECLDNELRMLIDNGYAHIVSGQDIMVKLTQKGIDALWEFHDSNGVAALAEMRNEIYAYYNLAKKGLV